VLSSFCGGRLFGEPLGPSPARVIALHGWARTHHDFAEFAHELADAGVGTVSIDLPGCGASPEPASPGGARAYAEMVEPLLAEVSSEPVVIVGHSFGGRVALCLADRAPAKVRALVLTGVPLVRVAPPRRSPTAYRVWRTLARWRVVSPARLDAARERYGSADYRAARGVMREVLVATVSEEYGAELARCRAPVTLVWGSLDAEVPLAVARRAEKMVAAPCEVVELAGVGHFVPSEAPGALAAATKGAL
jgi:pimeloyl-ACP methyl ester carboxylesterase